MNIMPIDRETQEFPIGTCSLRFGSLENFATSLITQTNFVHFSKKIIANKFFELVQMITNGEKEFDRGNLCFVVIRHSKEPQR